MTILDLGHQTLTKTNPHSIRDVCEIHFQDWSQHYEIFLAEVIHQHSQDRRWVFDMAQYSIAIDTLFKFTAASGVLNGIHLKNINVNPRQTLFTLVQMKRWRPGVLFYDFESGLRLDAELFLGSFLNSTAARRGSKITAGVIGSWFFVPLLPVATLLSSLVMSPRFSRYLVAHASCEIRANYESFRSELRSLESYFRSELRSLKSYLWSLRPDLTFIKSNLWFFSSPQAYLELYFPVTKALFKALWKPFYFFRYQFKKRLGRP